MPIVTFHLVDGLDSEGTLRAPRACGAGVDDVLDEYRSHSPLGRPTTTDEVAWAGAQLLAPEAVALHGATLALDGGARRRLF